MRRQVGKKGTFKTWALHVEICVMVMRVRRCSKGPCARADCGIAVSHKAGIQDGSVHVHRWRKSGSLLSALSSRSVSPCRRPWRVCCCLTRSCRKGKSSRQDALGAFWWKARESQHQSAAAPHPPPNASTVHEASTQSVKMQAPVVVMSESVPANPLRLS